MSQARSIVSMVASKLSRGCGLILTLGAQQAVAVCEGDACPSGFDNVMLQIKQKMTVEAGHPGKGSIKAQPEFHNSRALQDLGSDYCDGEYDADGRQPRVCGVCQGDCDNDAQCAEGLLCYQRDNSFDQIPGCDVGGCGDDPTHDYCFSPFPQSTMLKMDGGSYCTPSNPCDQCQGDCDSDADCAAGLKCWQRDDHTLVPGCARGGDGDLRGYDYCYKEDLPKVLHAGKVCNGFVADDEPNPSDRSWIRDAVGTGQGQWFTPALSANQHEYPTLTECMQICHHLQTWGCRFYTWTEHASYTGQGFCYVHKACEEPESLQADAADVCTLVGEEGYCPDGYYAGWDNQGLVLEDCKKLCADDAGCKFISFCEPGYGHCGRGSCSRYSPSSTCNSENLLVGGSGRDHVTYDCSQAPAALTISTNAQQGAYYLQGMDLPNQALCTGDVFDGFPIKVNQIPADFCEKTYQPDWCKEFGDKPLCIAFTMYDMYIDKGGSLDVDCTGTNSEAKTSDALGVCTFDGLTYHCPVCTPQATTCNDLEGNIFCTNYATSHQVQLGSLELCKATCLQSSGCSGGYFWSGHGGTCYLFGVAGADPECSGHGVNTHVGSISTIFACQAANSFLGFAKQAKALSHDGSTIDRVATASKFGAKKRVKLDDNQKVYIQNQPVLGDGAGEGALGVCRELAWQHVRNPDAPAVKVCGTGIRATFFLRGRCASYYEHSRVIGKCNTGAPPSTCDSFSPAQDPKFGHYQSYLIEQCPPR